MFKKCLVTFLLTFIFGLFLFNPKIYASSSYISSLDGFPVVENAYNLFLNSGYDEPNDILFYIGSFNIWKIYFVYDSYVESNYFGGNFYGRDSNATSFYGPYSGNIISLNNDIYNIYIYHIRDNVPTEVEDEFGVYPNLNDVVGGLDNYMLVYYPNADMRKYRLYVSSDRFTLTNNSDNYLLIDSSSGIDVYMTSNDSSSWVLTDESIHNFNLTLSNIYVYDSKINTLKGFNGLTSNLNIISFDNRFNSNTFSQDLPQRFTIKYDKNFLGVYKSNEIYLDSTDIPSGDDTPNIGFLPSDKIDWIPEDSQDIVNTNEYPYVILIKHRTYEDNYIIIQTKQPLRYVPFETIQEYNRSYNGGSYFVRTTDFTNNIQGSIYTHVYSTIKTESENFTSYYIYGHSWFDIGWSRELINYQYVNNAIITSNYNIYNAGINNDGNFVTLNSIFLNGLSSGSVDISDDDKSWFNNFIDVITNTFKNLFVPTKFDFGLMNSIKEHLLFLSSYTELYTRIIDSISNESNYDVLPAIYIDFSESENEYFKPLGRLPVLDLSFLTERDISRIKAFTTVIIILTYLLFIGSRLPNILAGVTSGMTLDNVRNAGQSHIPVTSVKETSHTQTYNMPYDKGLFAFRGHTFKS